MYTFQEIKSTVTCHLLVRVGTLIDIEQSGIVYIQVVFIQIRSEDKVNGIIDAEPKLPLKNNVKSVSSRICYE